MIERITQDEYIAKIEASAEWATRENFGDWVLFVRDEPNGPVSKFLGPDPTKRPLDEWIAFGVRLFDIGLSDGVRGKWNPSKFPEMWTEELDL